MPAGRWRTTSSQRHSSVDARSAPSLRESAACACAWRAREALAHLCPKNVERLRLGRAMPLAGSSPGCALKFLQDAQHRDGRRRARSHRCVSERPLAADAPAASPLPPPSVAWTSPPLAAEPSASPLSCTLPASARHSWWHELREDVRGCGLCGKRWPVARDVQVLRSLERFAALAQRRQRWAALSLLTLRLDQLQPADM